LLNFAFMKRLILILIVFVAIFFIADNSLAQCSQCKLLAEQSASEMDDAILGTEGKNNINTAILYIMAVPYIILSFLFRNQIARFFRGLFGKTAVKE
jgi:membrane glycosyltransferase